MPSTQRHGCLATSVIFASLLPYAVAINQQHCFGFANAGGGGITPYNVDAFFTSVSNSNICSDFEKQFKADNCGQDPINCIYTSDDGGSAAIGALLKGRTPIDAMNCVQGAFRQAANDPNFNEGVNGLGCVDVNFDVTPPAPPGKRDVDANETHLWLPDPGLAFEAPALLDHMGNVTNFRPLALRDDKIVESLGSHHLFRRDTITATTLLNLGDTIRVAGGQTLELIAAFATDWTGAANTLGATDIARMAQQAGAFYGGGTDSTIISQQLTQSIGQIARVDSMADYGIAGILSSSNIGTNDWIQIFGSLGTTMAAVPQGGGRSIMSLWRSSGVIVAAVALTLVNSDLPVGAP